MIKLFFNYTLLIIFISFSRMEARTIMHASNGVIDLSHENWDKDRYFDLSGDWEFYWNRFISWENFKKKECLPKPVYFPVPAFWNDYQQAPNNNGLGYATYRLKIILPLNSAKKRLLSLKIGEISSSYFIWADQKLIAANGLPGKNQQSTIPEYRPQTVSFIAQSDTLNIVVTAANFHYRVGGFMDALRIGDSESINRNVQINLSIEMFLAGTLFMIGLYHFTVYFYRRKEQSSFWFALVCMTITLRTLLIGENFICRFMPWIGWEIQNKFEYLTFYLAVLFVIKFVYSLYPDEMNVQINRFCYYISGFFVLLAIFTTARIYGIINVIFQLFVLAVIVYLIVVLIKAFINKETGAMIILVGFIVLGAATINDILYLRGIIQSVSLVPFGTFSFLFTQAILLSIRYSKAFISVEELSQRLILSYQDLENSQEMIAKQEKLASLGTMTAGIAHEINNPAQSIKFSMSALELNLNDLEHLICELEQSKTLTDAGRVEFINKLPQILHALDVESILSEIRGTVADNISAVKRIEQIVNSTKKYAHTDDTISNCDLNEIVHDSLILVTNQIKHDVVIKTHLTHDLPTFLGSPQEISQILINMITNSRDAIKEKGLSIDTALIEIKTDYDKENNNLILIIKDNGCGISKRHLHKIYDPFFTTKPIGKGTGLGLNIVYKLIMHHEGKIEVDTQKKVGTTFTVRLPVGNRLSMKKSFSISESGELEL